MEKYSQRSILHKAEYKQSLSLITFIFYEKWVKIKKYWILMISKKTKIIDLINSIKNNWKELFEIINEIYVRNPLREKQVKISQRSESKFENRVRVWQIQTKWASQTLSTSLRDILPRKRGSEFIFFWHCYTLGKFLSWI